MFESKIERSHYVVIFVHTNPCTLKNIIHQSTYDIMKMTQISIERDVVEELVMYKLRRVEEIIRSILERWNVTDADDFLSKARILSRVRE